MTSIAELLRDLGDFSQPGGGGREEERLSQLLVDTCDALLRRKWEDIMSKVKYTMADIGFLVGCRYSHHSNV